MKLSSATLESLSLSSFVCLDLETTGLDAARDEILEIGMVRVKEGDVAARFDQLVKPSIPIPQNITQLTGIRPQDCADKPSIQEKLSDIAGFIRGEWIIAHNAPFDIGFLSQAFKALPGVDYSYHTRVLDTLDLSRLLMPWLTNHRLETLAEYFEEPKGTLHRAGSDANLTGKIFLELIRESLLLDRDALQDILTVLKDTSGGLERLFTQIESFIVNARGKKTILPVGPDNVLGDPSDAELPEGARLDPEEVVAWFRPEGRLSEIMEGFEPRTPQMEMAGLVIRMFNQESFLLAEAGTGVGKSLAYLIPGLLWSIRNGRQRIIISTHTKTLQDQLFFKDLPRLYDGLDTPFRAVLLKGRNNYICLRRWSQLLKQMDSMLTPARKRRLLPLVRWVRETKTGDIEENAGFLRERNRDLWSLVVSESRLCTGAQCMHRDRCFFHRVRRAARSTNLLIINHSLLFADLMSGNAVLNEYDTLILDEAHQVERVATSSLGVSLQNWMFQELVNRLMPSGQGEGLLAGVEKAMVTAPLNEASQNVLLLISQLKTECESMSSAARDMFAHIRDSLQQGDRDDPYWKKRIKSPDDLFQDSERVKMVESALKAVSQDVGTLISAFDKVDGIEESVGNIMRELEAVFEQAELITGHLIHFWKEAYTGRIVWCEIVQRGYEKEVQLYSAPLDIGLLLSDMLYPTLKHCMMTSATLTIGGTFDYMLSRLGLDRIEKDRLLMKSFGSPYDYDAQVRFLIPAFLASPKSQSFTHEITELLQRILSVHSRGAMILFTSHKMLRNVYNTLQPRLQEKGIRLLGQGLSGSRSALLKRFQEDRDSVLLGTSSFWEGVDIPGAALELLVITKLPFDVPTEPLVEARIEKVEEEKGNGFLHFSVPEAVVRLKQGFGRLIRSGTDRGVVLLLDHRVVATRYGSLFLRSMPVKHNVCEQEDDLMSALQDWYDN